MKIKTWEENGQWGRHYEFGDGPADITGGEILTFHGRTRWWNKPLRLAHHLLDRIRTPQAG